MDNIFDDFEPKTDEEKEAKEDFMMKMISIRIKEAKEFLKFRQEMKDEYEKQKGESVEIPEIMVQLSELMGYSDNLIEFFIKLLESAAFYSVTDSSKDAQDPKKEDDKNVH